MVTYRPPDSVIYTGYDRLEVEVLVDGVWRYGEPRVAEEPGWRLGWAVTWSAGAGKNRLDTFSQGRLRRIQMISEAGHA